MYLNCLLIIVGFSITFCRKYYLLETAEKENLRNGVTSTTPASNEEFSNMARDAVIRSNSKIFFLCEIRNNGMDFIGFCHSTIFSRKVKK